MKTLVQITMLAMLAVVLPAPAAHAGLFRSKINHENYDKIANGMTKDQVREILGKPNVMSGESSFQGLPKMESWTYMDHPTRAALGLKTKQITIYFDNERVSGKDWAEL